MHNNCGETDQDIHSAAPLGVVWSPQARTRLYWHATWPLYHLEVICRKHLQVEITSLKGKIGAANTCTSYTKKLCLRSCARSETKPLQRTVSKVLCSAFKHLKLIGLWGGATTCIFSGIRRRHWRRSDRAPCRPPAAWLVGCVVYSHA